MKHVFFFLLMILALDSCKSLGHGKKSTPPNTVPRKNEPRDGEMSVKQAKMESIFLQGCIERSLGNIQEARLQFQQVLDVDPQNAAANYEIAGLFKTEGNLDMALKYAQAAVKYGPDNKWYRIRCASILDALGRYDEAITMLKEVSDLDPDNTDQLFMLGNEQVKAKKYSDALSTYGRIENKAGFSDSLGHCLVNVYALTGNAELQEKTWQRLIDTYRSEENNYLHFAEFYSSVNRSADAKKIYGLVMERFPSESLPWTRYAEIMYAQHEKDAFDELIHAIGIRGDVDDKIIVIKKYYPVSDSSATLSINQQKEADSLCSYLTRMEPENAIAWSLAGDYLYKERKYKEARDDYHRATSLDKNSYGTWTNILELNARLNDNAAQEKDCKEMIELFPTQPEAYYYLGMIQLKKSDFRNASLNLQMAKDYTFSRPEYESIIDLNLVLAYRGKGDDEKADEICEAGIKKDSANITMMLEYSASLSQRKIKLDDATVILRKVLQQEPTNGGAMELMGDVLFHQGRKDEALSWWQKAKNNGVSSPALDKKINTHSLD